MKSPAQAQTPLSNHELIVARVFAAPPEKVYRAWTEPELLKQWLAPRPWTAPTIEMDVRPGGSNYFVLRGPEGHEMLNRGVYLEFVKNKKLIFTDAYTKAWEPSEKPFMTVVVTFDDLGGKTSYTARVLHWTAADRERHEKMGFHRGWRQCADQLGELLKRI